MRDVLEVLHNSFPLRTCRHDFSFGHGVGGRHRPCLRYQMGLCLAPCTGNVFPGQYRQMLDEILAFLNGKHEDVVRKMRAQMLEASKNLDFERAATLRDRIAAMERVLQKQKALAVSGGDQDVVAVSSDGVDAVVEVIYMREGKILGSDHFIMQRAEAQEEESLAMFLLQYYDNAPYIPKEILLGEAVEDLDVMEKLLTEKKGSARPHPRPPARGQEKARGHGQKERRGHRQQAPEAAHPPEGAHRRRLQGAGGRPGPGLCAPPHRGLRHLQHPGHALGGLHGRGHQRPAREEPVPPLPHQDGRGRERLRLHGTRSSPAASPAASASGSRRRTRAGSRTGLRTCRTLCSSTADPSQLRFAQEAMHAVPMEKYPAMFGLAKRLEEIVPARARGPHPAWTEHSEALRLIQRVRDEAHRFAITHHRGLRTKRSVASRLEEIPGIGATRRRALLTHFPNVDAIREATMEELLDVPGMNRPAAEAVYAFFHAK